MDQETGIRGSPGHHPRTRHWSGCAPSGDLRGWAATAVDHRRVITVANAALLPLLVLAAGFEAIFALHINVERIGRYLQVFHDAMAGAGNTSPWRWATLPGRGPDALFSAAVLFGDRGQLPPRRRSAGLHRNSWRRLLHLLLGVLSHPHGAQPAHHTSGYEDLERFQASRERVEIQFLSRSKRRVVTAFNNDAALTGVSNARPLFGDYRETRNLRIDASPRRYRDCSSRLCGGVAMMSLVRLLGFTTLGLWVRDRPVSRGRHQSRSDLRRRKRAPVASTTRIVAITRAARRRASRPASWPPRSGRRAVGRYPSRDAAQLPQLLPFLRCPTTAWKPPRRFSKAPHSDSRLGRGTCGSTSVTASKCSVPHAGLDFAIVTSPRPTTSASDTAATPTRCPGALPGMDRRLDRGGRRSPGPAGSLFLNVGAKPTDPWTALDVAQARARHLQLQNTIHWIKSIAIDREAAGGRRL